MTAEMKAKWLEALRSGKYKQGQTFLRQANRYCCLGVLCDLDGAGWISNGSPCPTYKSSDGEVHVLLNDRINRLNIDRELCGRVSGKNDSGESFDEIADWLEENLPVTA